MRTPFRSAGGQVSFGKGLQTRRTPPGGFALVELMVAMVLLAVIVTSLGALTLTLARTGATVTGNAYRNGVFYDESGRLLALPYDSLAIGTTTITKTGTYAHTRQISITSPKTNVKVVTLIVTPSYSLYKPDTLTFTRTNPTVTTALDTP